MKHLLAILTLLFLLFSTQISANENETDDQELRLMYDSFIFSKDLNNAYTLAKKALKRYPKSLYWHKKMGEVALWTNKSNEAMDHITYIYNHTQDKTLADKLIKQLLATYQYKKALPIIKKEFQSKHRHAEDIISIYDKVGKPEEAIKLLKKHYTNNPSPWILSAIASLYLETGDIKGAENIVPALEKVKDRSIMRALVLSKYYFLQKNLDKAYQALLDVKDRASIDDLHYLEHLSDLGWYMHDEENAVSASLMLFQADKARKIDLDRLYGYYLKKDLSMAKKIALKRLENEKSTKEFIGYAQKALEKKEYKQLYSVLENELSDTNSSKILEKNPRYWLIKAEVSQKLQLKDESKQSLQKALALSPNSPEISTLVLWSLIDNFEYSALDKAVKKIEKQKKIDTSLYHPLAAAYLTLKKPDIAMHYLDKLLQSNPDDIDLQFLKVEILAAQDRNLQKRKLLKNILRQLDAKSQKEPSLLQDKQFLRAYLQAYMAFTSTSKFTKALQEAKPYLSKKDFRELEILNALKSKSYKKALAIYHDSPQKNPQFEMELAYIYKDKKRLNQLIQQYSLGVPEYIKVASLIEEDKIKKAIQTTKNAINHNQYNQNLKSTLAHLYESYTSHTKASTGYHKRDALKITDVALENFYYLAKGYGLLTKLRYEKYSSDNKKVLPIAQEEGYDASIGIRKEFADTSIEVGIHYHHDKRDSRTGISIEAETKLSDHLRARASIKTQEKVTDQSIQMRLAGKRDTVSSQFIYTPTENHQVTLAADFTNYHDSMHLKIGDGIRGHLDYTYHLAHYPQGSVRVFYEYGDFSERKNRGTLLKLFNKENAGGQLLQNDYSDVGVGLHYGFTGYIFDNNIYPFVDIAGIYSGKEKQFYSMLEAGLQTSNDKKHGFKFTTRYQNSIKGINNEEFGANLEFKKYYE